MSVREALEAELEEIARRDRKVADSALAAAALVLAGELDCAENSATSKSMCARALREVMDRLAELLPPAETKDGLDDLTARREQRLRGAAAANL